MEREVVQLVARGYSNKEIAKRRDDISPATIKTQLSSAMGKWGLNNRREVRDAYLEIVSQTGNQWLPDYSGPWAFRLYWSNAAGSFACFMSTATLKREAAESHRYATTEPLACTHVLSGEVTTPETTGIPWETPQLPLALASMRMRLTASMIHGIHRLEVELIDGRGEPFASTIMEGEPAGRSFDGLVRAVRSEGTEHLLLDPIGIAGVRDDILRTAEATIDEAVMHLPFLARFGLDENHETVVKYKVFLYAQGLALNAAKAEARQPRHPPGNRAPR